MLSFNVNGYNVQLWFNGIWDQEGNFTSWQDMENRTWALWFNRGYMLEFRFKMEGVTEEVYNQKTGDWEDRDVAGRCYFSQRTVGYGKCLMHRWWEKSRDSSFNHEKQVDGVTVDNRPFNMELTDQFLSYLQGQGARLVKPTGDHDEAADATKIDEGRVRVRERHAQKPKVDDGDLFKVRPQDLDMRQLLTRYKMRPNKSLLRFITQKIAARSDVETIIEKLQAKNDEVLTPIVVKVRELLVFPDNYNFDDI